MAHHDHDHANAYVPGYIPGEMDIHTQEKTFEGFIRLVTWGAGLSIAVLIFLALANS